MPSKKQLTLQQEYAKELKRIRSFIRRAEKRGYSFEGYSIPQKPKRITQKSVERLKKITAKKLYEESTYYDVISDKKVSGTVAQQLIRSRASKNKRSSYKEQVQATITMAGQPPNEVDDVLQYLFELIANWSPLERWSESFAKIKENDKNIMSSVLTGAINDLGERQVAKNVQASASIVKELAWNICYGSSGDKKDSGVQADLVAFASIVRGRSLTVHEARDIQDMFDAQVEVEYEDEDQEE